MFLQQSNFFAVLADTESLEGADGREQRMKKKKAEQSNNGRSSETKTAKKTVAKKPGLPAVKKSPEASMKAKPLVLPDHVSQKDFVLRRNYPERIEAAFDRVKVKQYSEERSRKEEEEEIPETFTLEEYEKMKLGKQEALGLSNKKRADDQQNRTAVDLEKAFGSMKLVGKKKEEIIGLSLKSKKAKNDNKKKKVPKSNSIDNFLKTVEPGRNSGHHTRLNCGVLEKQCMAHAKPAAGFENPAKFWGQLKMRN